MKKEHESKKRLVILILAAAALCLAGGLCLYLAKIGKAAEPDRETMQESVGQAEVTVPEIEVLETRESPEGTEKPKETEKPQETEETETGENGAGGEESEEAESKEPEAAECQPDDNQGSGNSESPKTREDAQAPTETPEPVDESAVENPEQPPQYEPGVTEPEQKPEEPAGGSTNGNGQVYVPGFGYVDPPGAPQGESAGSTGDWDKQIGDMN